MSITEPLCHCQICARAIKAKNGRIAHHGYKRPYQAGYQTRSCFGAKYRPYEVAHDALDVYIPMLQGWLMDAEAKANEWLNSPPDTISYQRKVGGYKHGDPIIYTRPDDFDAKRHFNEGSYSPNTYAGRYTAHAWDLKQNVTYLKRDIEELNARLAAWTGEAS